MTSSVETLLEALPYIREFHGRTIVIKYGGAAMRDEELREAFARDVVLLKYVGMNPVIVHGGGPEITHYMERMGMEVKFVEGLRVSDAETVEVAKMVLLGKINSDILTRLNRHGQPAVGLGGEDGSLFEVRPVANSRGRRLRRRDREGQRRRDRPHRRGLRAGDRLGRRPTATAPPTTSTPTRLPARSPRRCPPTRRSSSPTSTAGCGTRTTPTRASPRRPPTRFAPRSTGIDGGMRPKLGGLRRGDRGRGGGGPHRRRPPPAHAAARALHRRRHRHQDHRMKLAELQELEARWVMPTYARDAGRVRARRGRPALGLGGQGVPRLPGGDLGLLGRPLPPGGGRGGARAGRHAHAHLQPLPDRGRRAAGRSGSASRASAAGRFSATRGPRRTSARSSWSASTRTAAASRARDRRPRGRVPRPDDGLALGDPRPRHQRELRSLPAGVPRRPARRPRRARGRRRRAHGGGDARADPGRDREST